MFNTIYFKLGVQDVQRTIHNVDTKRGWGSALSIHPHTVNANWELTATWEWHSPAILCRDLQHLPELLDPNGSKPSAGARRAHLLLQLTLEACHRTTQSSLELRLLTFSSGVLAGESSHFKKNLVNWDNEPILTIHSSRGKVKGCCEYQSGWPNGFISFIEGNDQEFNYYPYWWGLIK